MIIADSGSTKTTWRIAKSSNEFSDVKTEGINPYFQTKDDIQDIVYTQLMPNIEPEWIGNDAEINFYGAGCSVPDKVAQVKDALQKCFPDAKINVDHDLLGSARALLGKKKGIACILGTGSNSCVYDGNEIIENIHSWGYLFGDFGSGAHIGKSMIQAYANDELEPALRKQFENHGFQREVILNNTYQKPLPNRYLAGFAKLVGGHINHPQVQEIVENCFHDFFKYQIEKYTNYKSYEVSFIGSVAFFMEAQLKKVASERGITIGTILKQPIDGLTSYHFAE